MAFVALFLEPTARHLGGSLLGGDEVPAGGLALGGVADHRDFLRDVEGQEVLFRRASALGRGFSQIWEKVLPLFEAVVVDQALHPCREARGDPQPAVQCPCLDLLVVRKGQEGGGYFTVKSGGSAAYGALSAASLPSEVIARYNTMKRARASCPGADGSPSDNGSAIRG